MGKEKQRYDASTKTMWLWRKYGDKDTLVPNDELMSWSEQAREGRTSDGKALSAVNYVFADGQTAAYNSDALSFAKVGTYVGSLDDPKEFDGDDPSFGVREDFGM